MKLLLNALLPTLCLCAYAQENRTPTLTMAGEVLTVSYIRRGLTEFSGPELYRLLVSIYQKGNLLEWNEQEIEQALARLIVIRDSDPYEVTDERKGWIEHWFPNRTYAKYCLPMVAFQKTANQLRVLPVERRVEEIFSMLSKRPNDDHGLDSFCLGELHRAGKDAVPFILRHAPEYHLENSEGVMYTLARLDDERVAEYFINILEFPKDDSLKGKAAKLLVKFPGDRTQTALIGALRDRSFSKVDRHLPQQPSPTHKPYIGRYYDVQHEVAESLCLVTGQDWGDLYNEDHRTWAAWMDSGRAADFSPGKVERTDAQLKALVESLFHRWMSGRPNPSQPSNKLNQVESNRRLVRDLRQFGPRVVPILVGELHARLQETPLWESELTSWTRSLLAGLGWGNALLAAEGLKKEE